MEILKVLQDLDISLDILVVSKKYCIKLFHSELLCNGQGSAIPETVNMWFVALTLNHDLFRALYGEPWSLFQKPAGSWALNLANANSDSIKQGSEHIEGILPLRVGFFSL